MVLGTLRWKLALSGIALVAPALSIAQAPAGIEGDWQGTLKSGQSALRLVLHIARASDGRYFGQMESVDLGSSTLIDSIQLTGDSVHLELRAIRGTFEGSINAARTAMTGTWNQGAAVPIEFKRAVGAAVSEVPKPLPRYQPPPSTPAPAADSEKKLADARAATLTKNKALQDAFNAALAALAAKNFPVAIQKLEEASQLDASQQNVWANLGDAYVGRSGAETGADRDATLREALAAYQKAIGLKPNEAAFHNNYGLALARLNKSPEAQAELAKAAQLDPPQAAKYYFNLGAVFENSGQVDPAVGAFRKAIEADATYSEAYFQLGLCLFSTKRTNPGVWPDGTQQAFQKYLELTPNGPNAGEARARLQQMSQPVAVGVKVVGTPVMSKIAIDPCPLDAPAPATQFLSTDRELTMWFGLAGLSGEDTISIRHTDPSGAVSRVYGATVKPAAGGRPFCVGKTNLATMPPGNWSVAVYLNNNPTPLFPPLVFTLKRAAVRPPAPLAEEANLETTMKFIEDGLNAKGRVEFRDPAPGTNAADSALFFDEVTGAMADPRRCELSFHLLFGSAGGMDTLIKFRFADVDNLSVVPRHAQPPVFMLQPHTKTEAVLEHHVATLRKDPTTNLFLATPSGASPRPDQQRIGTTIYFSDEAAAQSMAAAMVHAVELCPSGQ